MVQSRVALGNMWRNKSFVGLYRAYPKIIKHALNMHVLPHCTQTVPIDSLYMDKIRDWESTGVLVNHECFGHLNVLSALPVRPYLTLYGIKFHQETKILVEIAADEVTWSWRYHEFAFAIFWSLSMYLTDEELAHPVNAWAELMSLAKYLYPGIIREESEWQAMMLALYERILALESGVKSKSQHYKGLISSKGPKRAQLFKEYLSFIKKLIHQDLSQ